MVVGYSLDDGIFGITNLVILSLTTDDRWITLDKDDVILLHSPLNKSFTYIDIDNLKHYIK